jgi:hypothetical protein
MNREELVKLIIEELPELQNLSEDQGFYEYEKAFDTGAFQNYAVKKRARIFLGKGK